MSHDQIESEIVKCFEDRKPALLYGNDTINRRKLILDIHKDNGGLDTAWEYVGTGQKLKSLTVGFEEISKAVESEDYKRIDKILGDYKNTSKAWMYFNCAPYDSRLIFTSLTHTTVYKNRIQVIDEIRKNIQTNNNVFLGIEPRQGCYVYNGLIKRRGTFFIDNLYCHTDEDKQYFEKLSPYIETRKNDDTTSGNWLVAYTHDIEVLPKHFLNQFKLILLDCHEEHQTKNAVLSKNEVTTHFPTPSGTKWSDVALYLIDLEQFKIKVEKLHRTVTYSEMGFKHKTAPKKTKLWEVLLRFATANNSPVDYYNGDKTKVEKDIQRLNGVLIKYFRIAGNPITYQPEKKGYVAEFKIYNKSYMQEHIKSKTQVVSVEEILDEEIDRDIDSRI
ncbi:MAG: hypothetical protein GY775_11685 [Candidatus Scalindua sp.]|nr:hypothetical protein [Candidatus Scalindua sp.]